MYEYQIKSQYFAQVSTGLEKLAQREIKALGAKNVKRATRGLIFESSKANLYRINYQSRLLTRILAPIEKFSCHATKYLYSRSKEIKWEDFLSPDVTFAIFSQVSQSNITHSQYAMLRLKDAIVDYFREKYGRRPNIDRINPDVWINLHIHKNFATINVETSGGSLHRRGYRKESVDAPMQETVAAAIIKMSEWGGKTPLYDPFCGSGTILAEALMSYCQIPSGILKTNFGFQLLPDYDKDKWILVSKEAKENIKELPSGLIQGRDISSKAIAASKTNLRTLYQGGKVDLGVLDFRDLKPLHNSTIITNPPYGIRLGNKRQAIKLYQDLGKFFKEKCSQCSAFVYFGDPELIKYVGVKSDWEKNLNNGGLEGKLVKFLI